MKYKLITPHVCRSVYRPPRADDDKRSRGHAFIVAGSFGKMGAATLMARAAISSGCGVVTAFVPRCGYEIMQVSAPEVMVQCDAQQDYISDIDFDVRFDCAGIGPGIGQHNQTIDAIGRFLDRIEKPALLDADVLNILGRHPELIAKVPADSILTPHFRELQRLLQTQETQLIPLRQMAVDYARKHRLIIVIKGAPTFVTNGTQRFENTTGNPALATAGSGDVLSGIITGLLAQSYEPMQAALLGVYLHGKSADLAIQTRATEPFLASDIISGLSDAFLHLGAQT